MSILNDWIRTTLGDTEYFEPLSTGIDSFTGVKDYLSTSSVDGTRIVDVEEEVSFTKRPSRANIQPVPNAIWFARMRKTRKVLEANDYLCKRAVLSTGFCGLRSDKVVSGFLKQFVLSEVFERQKDRLAEGTTQAALTNSKLRLINICIPLSKLEQSKIAEVLSTIDRAIEQTEALIAKQQRIKTGLMQDLLTRGIDECGNLRSEETHRFKASLLGRIPVEWEVERLGKLVTSAVDGPFGSNLKTEHYVAEPGVRVVRLQNIGNGEFIDADKAWISKEHARNLARHSVTPGDILIGSLGDDRRLFGRACLYPDTPHPTIVKADVFRIRCKRKAMVHGFAFRLFNLPRWRRGIFGLAQGVTRDRVNLTNLLLLQLPVPCKNEQQQSASLLDAEDQLIIILRANLSKLRSLKIALMQDLLNGKVRVAPLLTEQQEVNA